ncbi:MAG TPA: hypothetical protein VMB34_02470 [Acetobacteraceae bacterium]|nr:hypothetical protein [Acetobacteraceae bacterium]
MILVYEPLWTGTHHAPGNSVTIQTIAGAFPDQAVRVYAEATHLHELRADQALAAHPSVTLHGTGVSPLFPGKTHVVSAQRFRQEFAVLRSALRSVPAGEPCLVMLISATPTAIWAASLLARVARRRIAVQVGLHGNLNELTGWRSRNPLLRAADLPAAMQARHGGRVRFLVLDDAIRDEVARLIPRAAAVTDVLPLPANLAEVALAREIPFSVPVRIALVGQATEAKGTAPFLALARHFRATHPGKAEFHLVGRLMPGDDPARFADLVGPVSADHLSRAAFQQRLAGMHYVCLPLQPGYYSLSASGALIDAITWLKPVIATSLPLVANMFRQFGEIGYLCADADAMRAAIAGLVDAPDPARYAAQVTAMRRLRDSRMPDGLIATYRAIIRAGFGDLLEARPGSRATAIGLASPGGI